MMEVALFISGLITGGIVGGMWGTGWEARNWRRAAYTSKQYRYDGKLYRVERIRVVNSAELREDL